MWSPAGFAVPLGRSEDAPRCCPEVPKMHSRRLSTPTRHSKRIQEGPRHTYIRTYIHAYTHIHTYICTYTHPYIHTYRSIYIYIYTYIPEAFSRHTRYPYQKNYVCTHICMDVYIYTGATTAAYQMRGVK